MQYKTHLSLLLWLICLSAEELLNVKPLLTETVPLYFSVFCALIPFNVSGDCHRLVGHLRLTT